MNKAKTRKYKAIPISKPFFQQRAIPLCFNNSCLFLSLWLISILWWNKFKNYKFVQDDLILFPYFQDDQISSLGKIFGGAEISNRWRPITNLFTWLVTELVGTNHLMWFVFNVSMIAFTGFIIANLVGQKTKRLLLSWLVGFAFVTSRFQTGLVTQATFIVENIANLLFVILFRSLLVKAKYSNKDLFQIAGLFTALLLTHERYIAVGLPIVIMIYFKSNHSRQRILGVSLSTGIACGFLLVKKYVLDIPLFVGTGSAWDVGFSIQTFFRYTTELVFGLLGVNLGTPTLNGYVFQSQNVFENAMSLTIFVLSVAVIWNRTIEFLTSVTLKKLFFVSLFPISLFLALAIPIVSTIRIEQRWFIAPYIAFLYYFVPSSEKEPRNGKFRILHATLILTVFMNFAYLKNSDQIYFNQDSLSAEANSKVYLSALSESNISGSKVGIISNEDTGAFDLWYRNFFEVNFPEIEFRPQYYSSLNDAIRNSENDSVLELKNGRLSSVQANFEKEGYVLNGNYWLDGWAGKNFSIAASQQECRVLEINFLGSVFSNSVQISNSKGIQKDLDQLDKPRTILLKVENIFDVYDFNFRQVYIPDKLGINQDVRSLSTRVTFRCQK